MDNALLPRHKSRFRCWELVDAQAEHVLKSEGFTELDFETFKKIISRDTLNASENIVFDAAVRWSKENLRFVREQKQHYVEISQHKTNNKKDCAHLSTFVLAKVVESECKNQSKVLK